MKIFTNRMLRSVSKKWFQKQSNTYLDVLINHKAFKYLDLNLKEKILNRLPMTMLQTVSFQQDRKVELMILHMTWSTISEYPNK